MLSASACLCISVQLPFFMFNLSAYGGCANLPRLFSDSIMYACAVPGIRKGMSMPDRALKNTHDRPINQSYDSSTELFSRYATCDVYLDDA